MDVNSMYSANIPSWAGQDTYINGQSFVFVYEDQLEEMMARVDAGEDPQGPQTMGQGDGTGGTVGDLYENSNEDWRYGTATTSSSVDEEELAEDGETATTE